MAVVVYPPIQLLVVVAVSNHRGIDRYMVGQMGVAHFLEAVDKVRLGYPLLWVCGKRNRRIEVRYWLS